ncbi:hypothetical protein [Tenggerimyces flavus]|uniref:Adenylate and guanylate cyclase catalytic domain-containing protein n=1 Tax=Tenggerimyces flavus TaxID=1708749 RepID=A0ABV7Y829_9ACTN|nr:hypothetical protein [Tenggerimyces flavus]MBM7785410.1 hypothetical protein [Tenggerimyces flavus]
MSAAEISLDEAVELTRTGDVWVFRGSSRADRMIQTLTNAPVNHVGMSLVIEDLPALMWHAELGRSLPDLWTGKHQRGVQLHDLRDAVMIWGAKYGQRAYLRQLNRPATREMEDAVLKTIALLDGTAFPTSMRLATRWIRGRFPALRQRELKPADLETVYCAEVVALTYEAMGLLPSGKRPNSYDAGSFWSGDDLKLLNGAALGGEITVRLPASL